MGIGSAMVERECSTECVCVNETQKLKQVKGKETYCSASLRQRVTKTMKVTPWLNNERGDISSLKLTSKELLESFRN